MSCPYCAGLWPMIAAPFQGPPGPAGPPGPQGAPGDYGYIRYGEMVGAAPRQIAALTETPFIVQSPQVITDDLTGPFNGFTFLGPDNVLRARKSGDVYDLNVRFSVVPALFGGWVRLSVNILGNVSGLAGPTSTRTIALEGAAGDMARFDEVLRVYPQGGFTANGATLSVYASVPVAISSDVLFVTPMVAAP